MATRKITRGNEQGPERREPTPNELLSKLDWHYEDVSAKLKLKGTAKLAGLEMHNNQLPALKQRLAAAKLHEDAERCQRLLDRVRLAILTD